MRKQIGVYEKILAAVAVSVFGVAILSPSASAATIPVDDVTAVGSPVTCNLQSAIESANTNTAVNGCVAGDPMPAVDTIELGNGAYQLAGDSTTVLSESTNLYGVRVLIRR